MKSNLILGIDAGNHRVKIAGVHGVDSFKSNICGWFERDVKEQFGNDDMEFQVGNRSKFLKRLIYDDLMQVHRQITTTHFVEPESIDEDLDAMQAFL